MSREITDKVRHAFVTDKRDSCWESGLPDAGKKEEEVNRNVAAKPECLTDNQVSEELLKLAKAEFIQTYRRRNHFRDLLLVQAKISGLKMWLFEMLIAAICICIQETFRDPYFMTFRKQLFLLTCLVVSVPLLMLPFLYRSIRYQMFEVECASVFSIRTVLFSKFLVFFGGEVGMTAALKGMPKREGKKKIDALLEQVSLADVRKKKIVKLSGGMKRRVGIAQALLNDPEVLILDEPTSGLDPGERVRFRNLLSEFARDRIVVISTHIVSDVEYIANQNAIMKDGSIIENDTTENLVHLVDGKIWECQIPSVEMVKWERMLKIISLRNEADGNTSIRYLADHAETPDSVLAVPRLEDLYLWLFRQEGERHA